MEPLVWVLKEVNKGARRGGIKAHLGSTLCVSQAQGIEGIVLSSDCLIKKAKWEKMVKKSRAAAETHCLGIDRRRRIDKWDKIILALGRESKQQWKQSEHVLSKREWLLAINATVRTSKVKPEANPLDLAGGGCWSHWAKHLLWEARLSLIMGGQCELTPKDQCHWIPAMNIGK